MMTPNTAKIRKTLMVLRSLLLVAAPLLITGGASAQQSISMDSAYPATGVVEPQTIGSEPSLPARIQDRVQDILSNPNIRPLFGGLGDGTGFGGGVAFSTIGLTSPRAGFIGSFQITNKQYSEASGGVRIQQDGSVGRITFDLTAGYKLRPQENFWGSGAVPGSQRTNFDLQERYWSARLELRQSSRLRSGAEFQYSSTSIFTGENSAYPDTVTVFGAMYLPGMTGGELTESSLFVEYDSRGNAAAPIKGFYLLARISSVDGVNGSDFSYWHYEVDQRLYVPLRSQRHVFALRTLLAFNDTEDGSFVPFFRLARLGGAETLRGYDPDRFYGRNAAAWNAEYRTDLTRHVGAFAYTDFGQVFNRASEVSARNLRVTYGGGLQLKSTDSIVLRTYVAHSEERTRLMISFGVTF